MKYKMLATFMVVLGFFVFQASTALASSHNSNASVSLYRPFPNGIDSNNPQHALQQVEGRATWDSSYATTIASQAGRPAYVASEFRAQGYAPHASFGSTNSGVTGGGTVVPVADHNGSQNVKVFLMINIVSQKTVELMVRCGNPRLKPSVSVIVLPWKPFSKGTVIRFSRKVSKPVSITCPSGQKVSGTLTTTVSGFARASTWGKVQGSLQLKLREKINLQIKTWVSLHCGPAPKPPAPPTPPAPPAPPVSFSATATASASASAVCPDGTTATASASGFGSATSTVSQDDANKKANAQAQANAQANANASVKCGSAPPVTAPSVVINITTINDIPFGLCRPVTVSVTSTAAGSVMIAPSKGSIGNVDCSTPTSKQQSLTLPVNVGNNTFTVYVWAPSDANATTDTLTATPIVAGVDPSKNSVSVTYTISRPVRT